ncbi:hypothetical protein V6Z12_A05G377200 [Gossypium hirsutum]
MNKKENGTLELTGITRISCSGPFFLQDGYVSLLW